MCMNWVAVPVASSSSPASTASLTRSQDLTAGTRLPVFAVMLLIGLTSSWCRWWPPGRRRGRGVVGATAAGGLQRRRHQLALTVVIIPFECLKAASAAVGYHELRMNREGVGLDELVRVFE